MELWEERLSYEPVCKYDPRFKNPLGNVEADPFIWPEGRDAGFPNGKIYPVIEKARGTV
jgi:hypothetical protein